MKQPRKRKPASPMDHGGRCCKVSRSSDVEDADLKAESVEKGEFVVEAVMDEDGKEPQLEQDKR